MKTYKCAKCKGVFGTPDESDWNEEDRMKEYKDLHPECSVEEIADEKLCDDCFQEYKIWLKKNRRGWSYQ